ncbi:helix-turn-helix domain-containing protein [Pedobacter lithocola]|uniref:Helix-turn-helix domain-containing protein n=1 Tax=Pedobacter lithocola TaxID=1908239 RepID=A0ABV8PBZ3_9SPHI
METSEKTNRMHLGRKISRIRELRGMKQEALAVELGISQQAISKLEQSEEIEDSTLEKIAAALGLPTDAIKNFNEEAVFNIIGNTFTDSSSNNNNYLCTINPLEKIIELYERLLASEKEKNDLLKKL